MSCEGCIQKAKELNEAKNKVYEEALSMANATGHWYAIYTDEYNVEQFVRADLAAGYPVTRYVAPNLQHTNTE